MIASQDIPSLLKAGPPLFFGVFLIEIRCILVHPSNQLKSERSYFLAVSQSPRSFEMTRGLMQALSTGISAETVTAI
jgi:hypothetical protein